MNLAELLTDAAERDRDHVALKLDDLEVKKGPRKIWFVHDLPKGPTRKILKREVEPPDAA